MPVSVRELHAPVGISPGLDAGEVWKDMGMTILAQKPKKTYNGPKRVSLDSFVCFERLENVD